MPLVSLAALTILDAGPLGQARAAHAAGFEAVGLRLNPLLENDSVVVGDAVAEEALRAAMRETGLRLLEVGVFPLKAHLDIAKLLPVLRFSAELGACFIVCPVEDDDPARRIETLRALCDACAPLGLTVLVEFNPYSACRTVQDARGLSLAAKRDNVALVIDFLHLARSGGTVEDLAAVEPNLLALMHFCDAAPAPEGARTQAELRAESRTARRLPGEGVLPLADFVAAFPKDTPISVEAPSAAIAHLPAQERARRVLAATKTVLESIV
jgi:sugar phosphate isomerase/epimerase